MSKTTSADNEIRLKGIAVSPGIVFGKVFSISTRPFEFPTRTLTKQESEKEAVRFRKAVETTRKQLIEAKERLKAAVGPEHAYILDVHLLLLDDQMLIRNTETLILKERINAEAALRTTLDNLSRIFESMEDLYLRERNTDVEHTGMRIMTNLVGDQPLDLGSLSKEAIVIAHDLSPADTATMDRSKVLAFATDIGAKTSHTAIMARALEIPAVVGLEKISAIAQAGARAIVDGTRGEVIINPSDKTLREYRVLRKRYLYYSEELNRLKDLPAETKDGYRVNLLANLEIPEELRTIKAHGAQGVGLYRTEFIYLNRRDLPTEEEHFQRYKELAQLISPFSATIRTLDVGGDKFLSQVDFPAEINPAMGLRAIRFCLNQVHIFKVQLRAILRASAFGNLKIMFPMISGLWELQRVKAILSKIMSELDQEGVEYDRNIEVGVMIEVPSAALMADNLSKEVDFFSLGTNDLIQYTLAIDRVNEHVAYLYDPLHPSVLRLISETVRAAHRAGIKVSMCGEMAGEPLYVLVLMGMGLDELSMNPLGIPRVKKIIRAVDLPTAREVSRRVLSMKTGKEAGDYLRETMLELFPEDITLEGAQVCLL